MSVCCNRWLCAIVLLAVGGCLIPLPGSDASTPSSSTAASTSQITRAISSPNTSTLPTLSTSLSPYATTEIKEITTQGQPVSTTQPVTKAVTSASANRTTTGNSLDASRTTPTNETISTKQYPTTSTSESPSRTPLRTTNETLSPTKGITSPYQTSNSDAVTEGVATTSVPNMSTDHTTTEPLNTQRISTANGILHSTEGDQTSFPELPSTTPFIYEDTSTAAEATATNATSSDGLETQFTTSAQAGTSTSAQTSASTTSSAGSLTTPDVLPTTIPELGTTAGTTSTMTMTNTVYVEPKFTSTQLGASTSAQTSNTLSSGSSITPNGQTTIIPEHGNTTGLTSESTMTMTSTAHIEPQFTTTRSGATISSISSSVSAITPNGLSTSTAELGTTTSTKKSTTQPVTERSVSSSPKQTPPPFYPEPMLVETISEEAVKKIQIEIAISTDSSKGCNPSKPSTCDDFKADVQEEFGQYYDDISGYLGLDIIELRNGSIIVVHQVRYSYDEMELEEKGLSAQEVYDKTIGDVRNGKLGELTVAPCEDCKLPEDITDLCSFEESVDCSVYVADCIDGYIYCVSPCSDTSFCSSRGDCFQKEGFAAECSCNSVDNGFFFGDNCEKYFNQTLTIICIAVAGGFILGIAVACAVTRYRRKKPLGRYRQYYMDDMGEEGYLWNESYALEGEEDLIDLTEDDPKLEFAFHSSSTDD